MSDSPSAFKHYYNLALAQRIADDLSALEPTFPRQAFVTQIKAQLESLELKDRVRLMATALHDHLPSDYPQALALVMQLLGPENPNSSDMFNFGYHILPLAQFVESYGLEHFEPSMNALYEITKRFSSEFAIRPYLVRYPAATLEKLQTWAHDPNEHVRRLVSEGARPRLPWAMQLKAFIQDPSPTLALLELLKDDPSAYVQLSIGNHLNDIAKDHPDKVLSVAERWAADAPAGRQAIIKRALRTLVKEGNPRALAILGFGSGQVSLQKFTLTPTALIVGDSLTLDFKLSNTGTTEANVVVDFVIHFIKANGKSSPKVFKLTTLTLVPGQTQHLQKRHPMRVVSTRRYYPGLHQVELQVNGQRMGQQTFDLRLE